MSNEQRPLPSSHVVGLSHSEPSQAVGFGQGLSIAHPAYRIWNIRPRVTASATDPSRGQVSLAPNSATSSTIPPNL